MVASLCKGRLNCIVLVRVLPFLIMLGRDHCSLVTLVMTLMGKHMFVVGLSIVVVSVCMHEVVLEGERGKWVVIIVPLWAD